MLAATREVDDLFEADDIYDAVQDSEAWARVDAFADHTSGMYLRALAASDTETVREAMRLATEDL